MKTKLFFLAAAGSMFFAYNMIQNQWKPRVPANYGAPTNILYVQQPIYANLPANNIPINMNPTQQVYSYNDIVTTYNTAVSNESQLRANQQQLQGMLAQEQLRAQQQDIRARANPYTAVSVNVRNLEFEIRKLKQLRQNNLETAYMRLYLTYASIQTPPKDGRPALTQEQHNDARLRLENIAALKSSIQLEGTGYYNYPNLQQPYLTAAAYTPPLINPVLVQQDAHVLTYLEQQRLAALAKAHQDQLALQQVPAATPIVREGLAEPVPEDPTVIK